jgi:hypothetical protein
LVNAVSELQSTPVPTGLELVNELRRRLSIVNECNAYLA